MNLFKYTILLAMVTFSVGCVSLEHSPVTDSRRAYAYTWQQELELGREADEQIIDYYGMYNNDALTNYVSAIGERVLEHSHFRRDNTRAEYANIAFTFRVLDSPVVNAFALPGGYNYVTRGLLAHMTSEAQLAMVIGHEIAHVAARHASQQALRQQAGQILLIGTAVLGEELLGIPGQEVIGLGESAAQLLFLSYGRDAERESDRLGVEYAAMAGYAAAEGAAFFTALKRISDKAGHSIPSHLSSHPDPGEREVDIARRAATWKEQGFPQETVNQDEFYQAIDGMIMGDNPREGFTREGVFYHPDLAFSFSVPSGWTLINERSQVVLVSDNQQAVTIFSVPGVASPAEAVDEIGNLEQITVNARESVQIGGLPAVVMNGTMMNEGTAYYIEVTGIAHRGNVYRFLSYTQQNAVQTYAASMQQSSQSFRDVTDQGILDMQPARIRIVRADRTDRFSSFLPSDLPPGLDAQDIAIMNQVELDETVSTGTLLKLPR